MQAETLSTPRAPLGSIIEAHGLVKTYGDVRALDGLDLTVNKGTVLALLGPNGAGKTTAVSILTTLSVPDAGEAFVAGADVVRTPALVRSRIGLSGQYAAVDEYLTGFENLDLVGRLYRLGRMRSRTRARELLDMFSLAEAGDRPVKTYSGGMRRRLDLAGALIAAPPVLVLDEPTTGLDPRSRIELWTVIRELVDAGSTLLLTTQYMEEAERLADDIVVIDRGREIAHGSSDHLKGLVGGEHIEVSLESTSDIDVALGLLGPFVTGPPQVEHHLISAPVLGGVATMTEILVALAAIDVRVRDVGLRRPTLDDVFLALTGHVVPTDNPQTPDGEASDPEQVLVKEAS